MIDRLYEVVKKIESNDNKTAIRFERHFMDKIKDNDKALIRAKRYVYAFTGSLKAYLSFSVGRLQFMVYNLYHIDNLYLYLEHSGLLPVDIPFMVDEDIEKRLFELFIKDRMSSIYLKLKANVFNDEDMKTFAKIWNGSEDYARKIKHYWT